MNLREKKLPETFKGYSTEDLVLAWEKMLHGHQRYVPEETQKVVWDLIADQLPETYKGWKTVELLDLHQWIINQDKMTWEEINAREEPREKISAMNRLLREYKLAPVFQD